jgi:hypothetical protein
MADTSHTIVVAGDAAIDWVQWPVEAQDIGTAREDHHANWELIAGHRMIALPGGAMLLGQMVEAATGAVVKYPVVDRKLEVVPPEEVLHSLSFLTEFPWYANEELQGKEKRTVYRVRRLCGFIGPAEGTPDPLPPKATNVKPTIIVLDDAGNGFRDREDVWPAGLVSERVKPLVVLKMSQPLAMGPLWDHVTNDHADRLVVAINANDLRMVPGVNISRRLSWERTARDFVWQMANNRALRGLAGLHHLVVRCGIDGALYYQNDGRRAWSCLYYDRAVVEDGFADEHPGYMVGFTSAFVAAIVAHLLRGGLDEVGKGVREGILCCRRLLQHGFGQAGKPPGSRKFRPAYPVKEVFTVQDRERAILDIAIPDAAATEMSFPVWSILRQSRVPSEELAYKIVRHGVYAEESDLAGVPVAQFGALKTADLWEIENFRNIRTLMLERLRPGGTKRPLCIAVFGPPGSGKSFGVTQVAASVAPGFIEPMEFNLAQFSSPGDLARALHQVHDRGVSGKFPLVFFDEFDTRLGSEELGWLKSFLFPMQEGKFWDGEIAHPIGNAIFVFAGGTANSFADFSRQSMPDSEKHKFKQSKGPDFVSRLDGHIDVRGPDPLNDDDDFAMIRRAVALRSQLERKAKDLKERSTDKANYLIDGRGEAHIDPGLLRAFIKVPKYKHGMRSMQSIIDMSRLVGRTQFEQGALPPDEQLDHYVDAVHFCRLLVQDALFVSARERIARAFHEAYVRHEKVKQPSTATWMQPWNGLPEGFKESNRKAADHIPAKLDNVGYALTPLVSAPDKIAKFAPEEIEILAEMEHERYLDERLAAGWKYGLRKNEKAKTNPSLRPWDKLPKKEKDKDRQAVRAIPHILAEAGFEMVRYRAK